MDTFLAAGGGFLVAVIWMDLMFDMLALRLPAGGELPESSLSQIAGYYRRVTTTASPMNYLISAVMAGIVGILLYQMIGRPASRPVAVASLALCGVPISLALLRVFPDAIRLGARTDSVCEQSRLAQGICRAHLLCLAAMLVFLAVRFAAR